MADSTLWRLFWTNGAPIIISMSEIYPSTSQFGNFTTTKANTFVNLQVLIHRAVCPPLVRAIKLLWFVVAVIIMQDCEIVNISLGLCNFVWQETFVWDKLPLQLLLPVKGKHSDVRSNHWALRRQSRSPQSLAEIIT